MKKHKKKENPVSHIMRRANNLSCAGRQPLLEAEGNLHQLVLQRKINKVSKNPNIRESLGIAQGDPDEKVTFFDALLTFFRRRCAMPEKSYISRSRFDPENNSEHTIDSGASLFLLESVKRVTILG